MDQIEHLLPSCDFQPPRIRHFLVERVRELLAPPSPVNYVKDEEQPLTGYLSKPEPKFFKVLAAKNFGETLTPQISKLECVQLDLKSSGLFARRRK